MTFETEANTEFFELRQQLAEESVAASTIQHTESVVQRETVRMRSELVAVTQHEIGQARQQYLSEVDTIKNKHDVVFGEEADQVHLLRDELKSMQNMRVAQEHIMNEKLGAAELCVRSQEIAEHHLYEQYVAMHSEFNTSLEQLSHQPPLHQLEVQNKYLEHELALKQHQLTDECDEIRSDRVRLESWAATCMRDEISQVDSTRTGS
jgi:hypothetical protein